jgi:hypothetical protein
VGLSLVVWEHFDIFFVEFIRLFVWNKMGGTRSTGCCWKYAVWITDIFFPIKSKTQKYSRLKKNRQKIRNRANLKT